MTASITGSRNRARGALLGLAAGDAVGTTVEFHSPGSFEPLTDMVGGGPFGLEPGQWTDDTSMALCLAESLVDRGDNDPVDQMRRYVRWWKDGYFSPTGHCFDIGNATRSQLTRFLRTDQPHAAEIDQEAAANGSLMRLAPVSIRWSHDGDSVITKAAESSRPTHAAARPVDACKLLAAMTAGLIRGEPWEAVSHDGFWTQGSLHPEVEAIARGSWKAKEPPAIRGTGYCVAALEAAIWAVAGATDFRGAILRAANLGDDADTTAAIAGQLAGARFGASGIPTAWLDRLAMRRRIESLADALHSRATGESERWDFDKEFHAWWAKPGQILAGEYPGSPEPAHRDFKLSILADAGIETIIDLTRDDDHLSPYSDRWNEIGAVRGRSLRWLHHPIRDLDVTSPAGYAAILDDIDRELASERPVFIHCWGGVGRTGTVVGMVYVARGDDADEALKAIEEARRGTRKADRSAPEMPDQVAAIRRAASRQAGDRGD